MAKVRDPLSARLGGVELLRALCQPGKEKAEREGNAKMLRFYEEMFSSPDPVKYWRNAN